MSVARFTQVEVRPLHGASYLWGAHHPHCDRHNNHLIWIGGHPICLGCFCIYTGALVGASGSLSFDWSPVGFSMWVAFHVALVLPTVAQPWIQCKAYKIAARLLLGFGTGSYLISGLFFVSFGPSRSMWLLAVPFAFGVVMFFMVALRRLKPSDPCSACPLGIYPTCEWNLPRLLAENCEPTLMEALEKGRAVESSV